MQHTRPSRIRSVVFLAALGSLASHAAGTRLEVPRTSPQETTTATAADRIQERGQAVLDELHEKGSFPGGSAALILPDGSELTFVVGVASKETDRAMQPTDRLMSGSIGKTYVAAAALKLVHEGRLALDDRVAKHLGEQAWYPDVPNADDLTLRHLLRHESGLPRYIFQDNFFGRLIDEPDKTWKPEELIAYVAGDEPLFAAGEGWAYSDTNYILAGAVIEKAIGARFYDYVDEHFLERHGLKDTIPTDRRKLPGLVQGYPAMMQQFGFPERSLDDDGRFVINPQFEWCGGGYMNTPLDLARWARILYSGAAFDGDYKTAMFDTVAANQLGPGTRYGPGTMERKTEAGRLVGHDGVFPGYTSTMGYFPKTRIAAAFQVNTDGRRAVPVPLYVVMVRLANIAADELAE